MSGTDIATPDSLIRYTPRPILVTGGAGFIGSNVARKLAQKYEACKVVVFDKLDYCSNLSNLSECMSSPNFKFIQGDVRSLEVVTRTIKEEEIDTIMHFAAETHVDNSFGNSFQFTSNNVFGTHVLLEASRGANICRFLHVSTDEVYGGSTDGTIFSERQVLNPTNPYSASKAASEMMVNSYIKSFKLPIITVRPNNVYGIAQHCEKLIPTCCYHLQKGLPIPIHGWGLAERDYLSVKDLCQAIGLLVDKGREGEVYNIGISDSYRVIDVAHMFSQIAGINCNDAVNYISDRLHNDAKYPIWSEKIYYDTGWTPKHKLSEDVVVDDEFVTVDALELEVLEALSAVTDPEVPVVVAEFALHGQSQLVWVDVVNVVFAEVFCTFSYTQNY